MAERGHSWHRSRSLGFTGIFGEARIGNGGRQHDDSTNVEN